MALRPGDEVSLTLNTPIHLSRYVVLKPFASVRRTMGADPSADEVEMRVELKRLYFRDLAQQLDLLDSALAAVGEHGTRDDLEDWCRKEMGDVDARTTQAVRRAHEGNGQAAQAGQGARRPARKRARKRPRA